MHPLTPTTAPDPTGASEYTGSILDPLTGLPDGRAFALLAERKMALSRRTLSPLSLLAIEIDRFASLDLSTGRMALRSVAHLTQSTLRDSDTACYLGVGVLGALLDNTSEAGAVWAASRVRDRLRSDVQPRGQTVSIGVSTYPTHAFDAGQLCDMGFGALHLASQLGVGRIEVAEPIDR